MIVRQFLQWAQTAPDEARAKATAALAQVYLRSDIGAVDRAEIEAVLPLLAADISPVVRAALAGALSRHPLVPAHVVMMLADLDGAPGEEMLAESPVLNEDELIGFAIAGNDARRAAIASRTRLPAAVAAVLAEVGDSRACLMLVLNAGADVPGFALGRIVSRFGHVSEMREALLERPGLPPAAHQALIRVVAGALSSFVSERRWLSPADAAHAAGEACERETMGAAPRARVGATVDVRAVVEQLGRRGALTSGLALRALLSGQLRLFLEMVSVLSDLPTEQVAAMVADRSGRSFRTLYDRLGLPRGAYVAFRTALELVQGESYLDEQDEALGLKRRIVDRVIGQYEHDGLTPDGNRLLGILRRWRSEAEEARTPQQGVIAA
ncbi:DUF2336 domain-containing protein [Ancylobacter amanitiformis]|uniref:Uncharacterized protein (DUF2336 family) n=1 Tax=Ancylobacter amanitiformis TaxID=217069 RepID=A0ABU0LXA4_9HYPH|nr:DUF2336 domain-containing protein [Ancylobacter amanitiformis]MDQ0513357.1 uncharacterized protein (DUF2336 family) [Ancylobacter amanitiformis]